MTATVKHWTTPARPGVDVRGYRTTVTIVGAGYTTAITLAGNLTRKQALTAVYDDLARESDRWSTEFLRRLRALADGKAVNA